MYPLYYSHQIDRTENIQCTANEVCTITVAAICGPLVIEELQTHFSLVNLGDEARHGFKVLKTGMSTFECSKGHTKNA